MSKKYFIITYGCQMNVHESEKLAGILVSKGYKCADNKESADIIVLNTCCIRETAETHVLGNLGAIKKIKERKPDLKVAVCGCMAQKSGSAEKLKTRCPFINIIIGTHNLHLFGEYLDKIEKQKYVTEIWNDENIFQKDIAENTPVLRTSGLNGWVNIMYGCNNFCSYCIVPYVRGREHSRKMQNIIDDVKKLRDEGYKEITLLGQNVNSYGNDLIGEDISFFKLLEALSKIEGKFRIKFMTSHPKDISTDVVKAIAGSPNISNYIHLPAQSGSDKILELMNRKYTAKNYLDKIDIIRKYIPDAGLSSDLMVGFPEETEQDFTDSLEFIKKVQFNNLYTFIYSRRSGTVADNMNGQIDTKTKKDRIKRLIEVQTEIGKNIARNCIGKDYEVLCFDWNQGTAFGRTDCNKIIKFNSKENIYGKFVQIRAEKSINSNLSGTILEV